MSSGHQDIEEGSLGSRRKQSVLPTQLAAPSGAIRLATESPPKTPEKDVPPLSGRSSHDGLGGSSSNNSGDGEMRALSASNARFYQQQQSLEKESTLKAVGGESYNDQTHHGQGEGSGAVHFSPTTGNSSDSKRNSNHRSRPYHGRAIPVVPRNFWQVVPTNHLYIIGVLCTTYLVLLAGQNATTIVTMLHTRYIEYCDIRIIGFLISWSVCGMVFLAALGLWTWLFVKHILPHYLKSARPLAKGLVRYSILVGFFCVCCVTVCIYGLWSSRFDDPNTKQKHPGTVRCGVSAAVTKAVCGSFLLMTFCFLVGGYLYHRWAEKRLQRKAKRATAGAIDLLTGNDTEQGHIFASGSGEYPIVTSSDHRGGRENSRDVDRPSRDSNDPTALASETTTENKYAARLHSLQLTPMKSKSGNKTVDSSQKQLGEGENHATSLDLKVRPTMLRGRCGSFQRTTPPPATAIGGVLQNACCDRNVEILSPTATGTTPSLLIDPGKSATTSGSSPPQHQSQSRSPPLTGLEPTAAATSSLNHSRSSSRGAFAPFGSGLGAYTPRSSHEGEGPCTPPSIATTTREEFESRDTPRDVGSATRATSASGQSSLAVAGTQLTLSAAGSGNRHSRRVSELSSTTTTAGPVPFAGSAVHRSTSKSSQQ